MAVSAGTVNLRTQALADLAKPIDQVNAGEEKVITKNGESDVASIDSDRLDHHRRERQRNYLHLLDEIEKGLADVVAGRTADARAALVEIRQSAKHSTKGSPSEKPQPEQPSRS